MTGQANETQRLREVALVLRGEVDRLADPVARAGKLLEIAAIYIDQVRDPREGSGILLQAVKAHPEHAQGALGRLAGLARETGDVEVVTNLVAALGHTGRWADVVTVLNRQADATPDPLERAGLLLESGRIAWDRLQDPSMARAAWLRAAREARPELNGELRERLALHIVRAPTDDEVARALAQLQVQASEPLEAVDVLLSAAAHVPDHAAKGSLLFDAALLCADRAERPVDALGHAYDAGVLDPGLADRVQDLMNGVLRRHGHLPDVAAALEATYGRLNLPEKVAEVLDGRLATATAPDERAELLQRAAEHAEYTLIEPERAFAYYRRGLEEGQGEPGRFAVGMRRVGDVGVPGAAAVMIELFDRFGMWRALVEVLDGEAALSADDLQRAEYFHRAGEVLEHHIEDFEGAMVRYQRAFKLQPRERRYLESGERLYRRRGDWPMVDRLLGLQVRLAPDDTLRSNLLTDQARVRHRHLDQPLGAYESLRHALRHGGGERAATALSDLVGDDAAFVEIARDLHARGTDPAAADPAALLELAALCLEVRDDLDGGVAALTAAADRRPEDVALFKRVATLLETASRTAELATWLGSAADRPLPQPVVVDALLRAARLHGARLGQAEAARGVLLVAAEQAPRAPDVFDALMSAFRDANPPDRARLLERVLAGELGPDDARLGDARHDLLRSLAVLRDGPLDDPRGAVEAWQAILSDDPLDPEAYEALRRDYIERTDWAALRTLLETTLEAHIAEGDGPGVRALRKELSRLAESHLDDPGLAAEYLRPLLRDDPDVRSELHRLYAACGDRDGRLNLSLLELEEATTSGESEARIAAAEALATVAREAPRDDMRLSVALRALADERPRAVEPLDELIEALRRIGDDDALVEVLDRRWNLTPTQVGLEVLRERARLLGGPLERLADAIRAWTALLALAPRDDEALDALEALHEATGEHEALLDVRLRRADAADAPAQRVKRLVAAAEGAERDASTAPRAIEIWRRVLGATEPGDPAHERASDALLRLLAAAEAWTDFVRMAQHRMERLDPPERIALAREVARTFQGPLRQPEQADEVWDRVLALDPHDVEALEARLARAEARSEHDTVAALLLKLLEATSDAEARRALMERRAAALEAAESLEAALEVWRDIADAAPSDRGPWQAMRRLAAARRDDWALADALARESALVEDPDERQAIDRRLAHLRDEALGDQLGAVEAWERVLACDANDTEGLNALKTLYSDLGRVDDMVRALRTLLEVAELPERRIALLAESAELLERHERPAAEVFECWWRAFRIATRHDAVEPRMLIAMRRLAEAGDLWDRYLQALERARRSAHTVEQQVEVLLQEARVAADRMDDAALALAKAKAAFELQPREGRVLEELIALAEAAGERGAVVEAYTTLLASGIARERRADILLRIADVEGARGDGPAAFEACAQALRTGHPDEAGLLEQLTGLAEQYALWEDLVQVYRQRWERQSQISARLETLHGLAQTLESRADDWERAFEQYLIALQLDPKDEATRAQVWRLAEAHGAWDVVIRVLELKARDAEAGWVKIALLHDIAALHEERLGDAQKAMETLRRAFAIETWNEKTHAALRRVAGTLSAWRELAAFFEEEAGWADEPHARLRLYRESAEILREHGEQADAARIYERVLELTPGDPTVGAALVDLYDGQNDHAGVARVLERRLEHVEEDERAVILGELATLYREKLEDPARAERAYQALVALRPADADVFESLAETLEARQSWERLCDLLEQRARTRPAERARALDLRRVELLETQLERPREALRLLARVARDIPADMDMLRAVQRLSERVGTYDELLACAERSSQDADPEDLPEVLCIAGRVARDQFGNRKKARQALARALDLRPDDIELAREVGDLLEAEQRYADLVELLQRVGPVYFEDDEPVPPPLPPRGRAAEGPSADEAPTPDVDADADAVDADAVDADAVDAAAVDADAVDAAAVDAATVDAATVDAATVDAAAPAPDETAELAGVPETATGTELDPAAESAEMSAELSLGSSDVMSVDVLEADILEELSPEDAAEPDDGQTTPGELSPARANEGGEAAARAPDANEAPATDEVDGGPAFEGESRPEGSGSGEAEAEFSIGLDAETDRREARARSRWALRVAELLADHLFRLEPALETVRTLVLAQPDNRTAADRMRQLAVRAQDPEALLDAATRLSRLSDPTRRDEIEASAARDLGSLGAEALAVSLWQGVLARTPGHEEAQEALARIAERRHDWALMAQQLEARIEAAADEPARAGLLCDLGRLHRDQNEDTDAARRAFGRALEADPGCVAAIESLVGLARADGRPEEVEALTARLVARLDASADDEKQQRLSPLVADLQMERVEEARRRGDAAQAAACLADAFARAPDRNDIAWAHADALYDAGDVGGAAAIWRERTAPPPPPSDGDPAEFKAIQSLRRARAFLAAREAGDETRALRAFEVAAQHPTTRIESLSAVANIHEAASRWEAAVRLREKLAAAVEDPAHRAASLFAAGLIVETRLERPGRALGLYDRALEEGLAERHQLRHVLALYREHHRHDQSRAIIERLLVDEEDPNQAAELYCALGALWEHMGDRSGARAAYREAVDRSPLLLPATQGLLALLDDVSSDERKEAIRLIWGAAAHMKGAAKIPVLTALGKTVRSAGDVVGALEIYEEILALEPGHLDATSALADLYMRLSDDPEQAGSDDGHLERAVKHRLAYLRGRLAEPAALRQLAALYRATGRPRWAVTPLRILSLVKEATREESEEARQLGGPFDGVAHLHLDSARRMELVADAHWRAPSEMLMRCLHEWVGEDIDALLRDAHPDAETWTPAEVLHPPLAEAVETLCEALELPPRRLLLADSDDRTVSLARLSPVELVAGGGLAQGLFARERRFLLGRALELTRGPAVYAAYVPAEEARALFAAAVAIPSGPSGADLVQAMRADPERVSRWVDFLVDRLDDERMEALEQLAGPVVAGGARAFDEWCAGVRRSANRVGLVMSGDPARAVLLLQREDPELRRIRLNGPDAFRRLADASPEIEDLYRYVFSRGFHDLLDALGGD